MTDTKKSKLERDNADLRAELDRASDLVAKFQAGEKSNMPVGHRA